MLPTLLRLNSTRLAPTLLLAVAGSSTAAAQFDTVDEAWARRVNDANFVGLQPIEVEAAPDGGVLMVGLARQRPHDQFDLPAEIVLRKFSENGDPQWSDAISSPPITLTDYSDGRYADAVISPAGDVFVVVARPGTSLLRRYSASGQMAWEVDLPLGSLPATGTWSEYNAAFVDLTPSGDVIVGGFAREDTFPRVDVRSYTQSGALQWEWRGDGAPDIVSTAQAFPLGLRVGPDGVIYMFGRGNIPSVPHGPRVIALSSAGAFLWRAQPFGFGAPFVDADFDSQGRVVLAGAGPGVSGPSIRTAKLRADGSAVFATETGVLTARMGATSIAVDAFDRISVGGYRSANLNGARRPAVFRVAPDGTYLTSATPSVALPSADGIVTGLVLTIRNDVIALGVSGTSDEQLIVARFAPDGAQRWSERRTGRRPIESGSPSVGLGFAADARGNLFWLAETIESGSFPNQELGVQLAKNIQNGPAGTSYCSPAPTNSTGQPAKIRAQGPDLLSANNVNLRADDLPPTALTLFLTSRTQGNVPDVGGGQGTLCLGGSIGRFFGPGQVRIADSGGAASLQLDLDDLPQPMGSVGAVIGETWNFQAWYRDANPGPTSNLTDGTTMTVQ